MNPYVFIYVAVALVILFVLDVLWEVVAVAWKISRRKRRAAQGGQQNPQGAAPTILGPRDLRDVPGGVQFAAPQASTLEPQPSVERGPHFVANSRLPEPDHLR